MNRFQELVASNPKGLRWSFALTITGLPDIYSDGQTSWAGVVDAYRTDRPGTLATGDFKIDLRADPAKPLLTGGEIAFDLNDDGTEQVFRTFAPGYAGATTYLTADVTPTATSLSVSDGTIFTAGDYVHLGALETVEVTSTAATSIGVNRGQLDTRARKHRVVGAGLGNKITTSPLSFKNRIVTLYMAPLDSSTGLLDASYVAPIWAGPIVTIRQAKGMVQLQCATLGSILESEWPAVLPTGRVGIPGSLRYVDASTWAQGLKLEYTYIAYANSNITDTQYFVLPFREFDEAAASPYYTQISPPAGYYPIPYIIQLIQDSLRWAAESATFEPWLASGARPFRNITLEVRDEQTKMVVRSTIRGPHTMQSLTVKAAGLSLTLHPGSGQRAASYNKDTGIGKTDTNIPVYLDSPLYPIEGTFDTAGGYIRISDGSDWEVIGFTAATVDPNDARICYLGNCLRGMGGTTARNWGFVSQEQENADESQKAGTVTQLLMAWDGENGLRPENVVLALLLSSEELYQDTSYEFWSGYRQCLGLPTRFVDYEGIVSCFQKHGGFERINAFWVDEKGKGKTSLDEFMRYYGMYFVTRQFYRTGDDKIYFGLSVESIEPPVSTAFNDTITDADRVSGSPITVDHNERLVVNVCNFKGFYNNYGQRESDLQEIFEYDEYSIAEYGAQKAMEFKATIFDWTADTTQERYTGVDAQRALATNAAYRWFCAFGNGNYKLSMTVPAPVGWRFNPGDHILLSLSGVRSVTGTEGLTNIPGRIYNVMHTFGERANTNLEIRLSFDNNAELAPCARVLTITSNTITVSDNFYTTGTTRSPFDNSIQATDADWFDAEVYGAKIYCQMWTEGQYATTVQNFGITARNGSTLTVDTNLTATTVATNLSGGARTIMSFQAYSTGSTTLQLAFAHIADNGNPPTLGSSSAPAKEYG
jgi:hypothetical protein